MTADPAWLQTARAEGRVLSETGVRAGAIAPPTPESVTSQKTLEKHAVHIAATVHVLWLPGFLPVSTNEDRGHHWSVKARIAKAVRNVVAFHAKRQGLCRATTPRSVGLRLVLPKGQRGCDKDNLKKSLWDALVHAGLLVNDSPRWCHEGPIEYVRHGGALRETFVILTDEE